MHDYHRGFLDHKLSVGQSNQKYSHHPNDSLLEESQRDHKPSHRAMTQLSVRECHDFKKSIGVRGVTPLSYQDERNLTAFSNLRNR